MASFIRIGPRFLNLDLLTDARLFTVRTYVSPEGEIEYRTSGEPPAKWERIKDSRALEMCFLSPAPPLVFYGEEALRLSHFLNDHAQDVPELPQ